jgi:putative ABC transport system permease protein
MGTLLQDLRFGIRILLRNPGFTLVAVLALALGIGANTAIFSVVNGVLLRPLPYKNSDRLVLVWETNPSENLYHATVAPPNFFDWRAQNLVFDHIVGIRHIALNLTGQGNPEQLLGAGVSYDLFKMLEVEPVIGRSFLPEDDRKESNRVAIISHGLWQRRFGSDPSIIGKPLTLNNNGYTVVGVTPANFRTPEAVFRQSGSEVWIPLSFVTDDLTNRNNQFLYVMGRLQQNISIDYAEASMNVVAVQLSQQYPDTNEGRGVKLTSLKEETVGKVGMKLFMLLGAVGFILLIACANVANMLLARAAARQKEIAIRLSLGAGRWRIIRQLITESVLLSFLGGILSLLLAMWACDLLVNIGPDYIPRLKEISLDRQVLGFTFAISILTGILFGLAPALHATKPDISRSLKDGGISSTGIRGNRLRSMLVVAEVALSLVLLIGAGLLINSLLRLQMVDPGFRPENVLAVRVGLTPKYSENPQKIAFFKQLIERIEALPGAESVGAINDLPLSGNQSITRIVIEGQPAVEEGKEPVVDWRQISPNYFKTMGIPLIIGRDFTSQDDRSVPPVAIINQSLAQKHWPDQNPIGKRFKFASTAPNNPWITVIGLVGDIRHLGLNESEGPALYISYLRSPRSGMFITVRSNLDRANLTAAIQKEIWAMDIDQPIASIKTMDQFLSKSTSEPRFYSVLLGIFAVLALVIAAVGIYGVMSYTVAQRTHEIGIRMALGAQPGDVLRLILGKSLALVIIGVIIGVAAASVITRILAGFLFGITPTDPITFATISLILSFVALIASYLPARRATKVDPIVALRYE